MPPKAMDQFEKDLLIFYNMLFSIYTEKENSKKKKKKKGEEEESIAEARTNLFTHSIEAIL